MRDLTNDEQTILLSGHCPYCGGTRIKEGPRGGAAVNIYCSNPECEAGFNVTPIAPEMTAQLIRNPNHPMTAGVWLKKQTLRDRLLGRRPR